MPGVDNTILPPGRLAKLHFLIFSCFNIFCHLMGKVDLLQHVAPPFLKVPMQRFSQRKWRELLFIAKVRSLSTSRAIRAGGMFQDIPVVTLTGETRSLGSYLLGKPLVLNFGSLS
ncbi:hypothetical protein RRG08_012432 [Elysia crispata]|uniref:Uncharacterized protein n=1 Tax=Elysia crispata TaxID=231223 RepID=A0AAE1AFA2_9GAST|nr:hypothetical protein RRG08_012432 [Elysia crispata]